MGFLPCTCMQIGTYLMSQCIFAAVQISFCNNRMYFIQYYDLQQEKMLSRQLAFIFSKACQTVSCPGALAAALQSRGPNTSWLQVQRRRRPVLLAQHDASQIRFPSDSCSPSCLSAIVNPKQAKDNKSFNFDYSYWSHTSVSLGAPPQRMYQSVNL